MSRTINTMPTEIQLYEKQGKKVPKDWRWEDRWRNRPQRNQYHDYDNYWLALVEWESEELVWVHNYGGTNARMGQFRKELTQQYRAKCKQKMREGKWDDILPPRRNAAWLYW